MEGRMEGKRGRGRPRQNLMDWMMDDGYGRHKTLSEKLISLDLPDHIYNWMVDYFMDRGHSTHLPDVASIMAWINASIIQGIVVKFKIFFKVHKSSKMFREN